MSHILWPLATFALGAGAVGLGMFLRHQRRRPTRRDGKAAHGPGDGMGPSAPPVIVQATRSLPFGMPPTFDQATAPTAPLMYVLAQPPMATGTPHPSYPGSDAYWVQVGPRGLASPTSPMQAKEGAVGAPSEELRDVATGQAMQPPPYHPDTQEEHGDTDQPMSLRRRTSAGDATEKTG